MINIIIAESHIVVRNGIRSLLENEKDFIVTGEAVNGAGVISLLSDGVKADVVLSDMEMTALSSIDLISKIQVISPHTKVLILSMCDDEQFIAKAVKAGAAGYLLKNISSDELFFALRHVHGNHNYFCSELATRFISKQINSPYANANSNELPLTVREKEVLNLLAAGYTNNEIANKLFTSQRTVEGVRQSMLGKMQCKNTLALIVLACRNGIINYADI